MALFDRGTTLEDALGQQAESSALGIERDTAKRRKRAVSQQAAQGRLTSGVANFPLGDIDAGEVAELGDVEAGLAGALGQIPVEDFASTQEFNRQRELARFIASLNKQNKLGNVLGGAASGASAGASVGGPWGAVAGGVGGGVLGGLS